MTKKTSFVRFKEIKFVVVVGFGFVATNIESMVTLWI